MYRTISNLLEGRRKIKDESGYSNLYHRYLEHFIEILRRGEKTSCIYDITR